LLKIIKTIASIVRINMFIGSVEILRNARNIASEKSVINNERITISFGYIFVNNM
jgi:hypothetical protein